METSQIGLVEELVRPKHGTQHYRNAQSASKAPFWFTSFLTPELRPENQTPAKLSRPAKTCQPPTRHFEEINAFPDRRR